MLFTTLTLRSRLVACAASMALAAGLVASPANAGSRENPWLQRGAAPEQLPKKERMEGWAPRGNNPGRGTARTPAQPAQPAQPVAPAYRGQKGTRGDGRLAVAPPPQPPRFNDSGNESRRDRQRVRRPAPPPPQAGHRAPAPVYPPKPLAREWRRHEDGRVHDGRRLGDDRHYDGRHDRHETHVTHVQVQRYYYYRTSARHYHYLSAYPQAYPYPVYYLVPYHVHTEAGYHNHGEQSTYCADGYTQGGVYRGGAYPRGVSHQPGATIIGSILGAATGYQFGNGKGQLVAVGVGTLLGALIGSDVGRAMDERDYAYATGSFGQAMDTVPSCTTISWNNPQTGNYGSVTPTNTYEPEPGRYCREFQQQVVIGGKLQDAYGTACRQPDGSWEIVAEQP